MSSSRETKEDQLRSAAMNGDLHAVKRLLKEGVDPNNSDSVSTLNDINMLIPIRFKL